MAKQRLYTIGYEGAVIEDFLATLSACGVGQVIDIRDVPVSRKKGFSKSALAEALSANGITYTHLKDLGDPKPGREAARRGEFAEFKKIFARHLKSKSAQNALAVAVASAEAMVSCLLCFERSPTNCHRTIVATAMAEDGRFHVKHVGVQEKIATASSDTHGRSRDRASAVG